MIFAGTTLEFGSKQRLVALHGIGYVIYNPVVVHIAVRQEFRNMIHTKNDFTLIKKQILVHGNVNREFVPAAINPAGKIVVQRNCNTSFTCHSCQHSEVVAIIFPPEVMPFMIAAAVSF